MPILLRHKLYAISALVILANAADLLSTWYVSPNLANEWNVLERSFGLGWYGIIGAKMLGGLLAVLGYAYYLHHRDACYPQPGADSAAFRRHLTFGRQAGLIESQMGIPIGIHLGVNLGYLWAGMQLLVLWVAVDNVLLRFGIVFPLRHVTESGYHLLQSLIVGAFVLHRFYSGNYHRYRSLTSHAAVVSEIRPSAVAVS